MADGVARAGFDVDLAFGEARETAFVSALRSCQVECKSDQKARVTGNVFIEFRQNGQKSGLATTSARWWAIEVEDDIWILIRTSALKALALCFYDGGKGVVRGGDFNNYEGVLIPIERLVRRWQAA